MTVRIPDGMFAGRFREVRSCVNPERLYWSTPRQHLETAVEAAVRERKTRDTCKYGHPLDALNNRDERYCKTCANRSTRRSYDRNYVTKSGIRRPTRARAPR